MQPLKDWLLFLIVMVMVAVDVVFLIIVSIDPLRQKLQQRDLVDRSDPPVSHYFYLCNFHHRSNSSYIKNY